MNAFTQILSVAAGGAIGASLRYGVMLATGRVLGVLFPWGTVLVNIIGSFGLGVVIGWFAMKSSTPEWLRLFLVIGVAGGFTTFSSFSLDAVTLWERKEVFAAGGYVIASVVFSIAALVCGMMIMRHPT